MGKRAKAGARLEALVAMAVPLLQEAQRQCPRTGPGAKPTIPDWLIGVLIMVAMLKRKKTKAAQWRFITDPANRARLAAALGRNDFPSRSRWYDRYRRAHRLFQVAIRLQGQQAIAEGVADPRHLAVDKSLIEAHGPRWHKRDRERGKVPAGVDQASTWGYSEHDGWVQGFSYEVVVSATKIGSSFPCWLRSIQPVQPRSERLPTRSLICRQARGPCRSTAATTPATWRKRWNGTTVGSERGAASSAPKILEAGLTNRRVGVITPRVNGAVEC